MTKTAKTKRVLQACRKLAGEKLVLGMHAYGGGDCGPSYVRVEIDAALGLFLVEEIAACRKRRKKDPGFLGTMHLEESPEFLGSWIPERKEHDKFLEGLGDGEGPMPWPTDLPIPEKERWSYNGCHLLVDHTGARWKTWKENSEYYTQEISDQIIKDFFHFRVRCGKVV